VPKVAIPIHLAPSSGRGCFYLSSPLYGDGCSYLFIAALRRQLLLIISHFETVLWAGLLLIILYFETVLWAGLLLPFHPAPNMGGTAKLCLTVDKCL
jgi:hypothetical protein